jgi:hypothetical protein
MGDPSRHHSLTVKKNDHFMVIQPMLEPLIPSRIAMMIDWSRYNQLAMVIFIAMTYY